MAAATAVAVAGVWCSTASAVDGRNAFNVSCASCHSKDGRARTPIARRLGVKDLSQSKLDDAAIKKQILQGVTDKDGKQKMPPFEKRLSAEEIEAVIEVVKSFRK